MRRRRLLGIDDDVWLGVNRWTVGQQGVGFCRTAVIGQRRQKRIDDAPAGRVSDEVPVGVGRLGFGQRGAGFISDEAVIER